MASPVSIEVIAADDPQAAALELFRDLSPRTLVLAGGSTPRKLYEAMAGVRHPWAETDVFFSDERCVRPDDPDSNYRMATEALLSKVPARVHAMTGVEGDAAERDAELCAFFGERPMYFDLAYLGLGEEGHTASLFPGDPALNVSDRFVVAVQRPDHRRLSLTVPALSAASVAVFLVVGKAKAAAVKALIEGADIPATRVKAARTILIADHDALALAAG
jgi:6-phosphogluconolactonase